MPLTFLETRDPFKVMHQMAYREVSHAAAELKVPLADNESRWLAQLLAKDLLRADVDIHTAEVLARVAEAMVEKNQREKGRLLAVAGKRALLIGSGVGLRPHTRESTNYREVAGNVLAHAADADPTIDLEFAHNVEAIPPENREWFVEKVNMGLTIPWLAHVSDRVEPFSAVLGKAGGQLFYGEQKRFN